MLHYATIIGNLMEKEKRLKHCNLSTIPKRAHKPKPPKSGQKTKICLKFMQ